MLPRRLRKKLLLALLLWLTALPAFSQASMPLVDTVWLRENLDNPSLRVLDLLPVEYYRQVHIPGAVNTDYNQWRATGKHGVPKMLPDIDQLERLIGSLGIGNDTHVVIAPPGQGAGDMAMATRIYWTLHLLGHRKLSILDGGLIGYLNDRS
ncbi:MAG: rhodanese-like domain-containing protein, partial [Pseudomonadota bacterium]|nr:rhodanese-like domain-containing protein [Pseudomonadota bacterium]